MHEINIKATVGSWCLFRLAELRAGHASNYDKSIRRGETQLYSIWREKNTHMNRYIPIHRKLHLLLIIRNGGVDLMQLHPDLGPHVPTQSGTDHAGAEMVIPGFRV